MQQTVLTRIVDTKKEWLSRRQRHQPLESFIQQVKPSQRHFYDILKQRDKTHFIMECKKASPSKGLIRDDFDPVAIAGLYRHYASVISVLTDEDYFQGSFDYVKLVSETTQSSAIPVLCKDFIIDAYQIYLARYYQADAILLMLSVLDDEQYQQLAAVAHQLNMGVLTEVSNPEELSRAIQLKAQVVGINNRDLRDLSIDLNRTAQLAQQLPTEVTVISESGILTHQHVRQLSSYAHGFLIGSALMAEPDVERAIRRILYGDNKVCGLTRQSDAQAAYQAGANWGGLIFVDHSPRCVTVSQARAIMQSVPLYWVGVFRDTSLGEVADTVQALNLQAVQLHGNEDAAYITALRATLPSDCQIWKALSVAGTLPDRNLPHIDRYVFDQGNGGSGIAFDWSLLHGQPLNNVLLAGGIQADNLSEAVQLGCVGLDFNSGVESAPGIKNHASLQQVFNLIRNY